MSELAPRQWTAGRRTGEQWLRNARLGSGLVLMTFVVSGISTVKALGLTAEFLQTWPGAWALSWLVAFPTLLLVLPLVRRLVALVVAPPA